MPERQSLGTRKVLRVKKTMSDAHISAIRFLLFLGGLVTFLIFELTVPYRPATISKVRRWIINLLITGFNSIVINIIFAASLVRTISYVTDKHLGILNIVVLPYWTKILFTVIFMDFMIYVWHLLNHEMPLLWRFHRVHHCDLNMDVSTAARFHIGELAVSFVIKISLVFFLGADFLGVAIFESAVVLATQFHHSSLKVPIQFETLWQIFFVPPSMHRIHHSVVIKERNTNYGVIFSVWDRMLGAPSDHSGSGPDQNRNWRLSQTGKTEILSFACYAVHTAGQIA